MPPPAGRPHRRKMRPPPTTARATAPGIFMVRSKDRKSSLDATSRQRGIDRDGRIAGPRGARSGAPPPPPALATCSDALDVPQPPLPATTARDLRSRSAAASSILANRGDPPPPRRRSFAQRRCQQQRREGDAWGETRQLGGTRPVGVGRGWGGAIGSFLTTFYCIFRLSELIFSGITSKNRKFHSISAVS
jgi:hypothetical protein